MQQSLMLESTRVRHGIVKDRFMATSLWLFQVSKDYFHLSGFHTTSQEFVRFIYLYILLISHVCQ